MPTPDSRQFEFAALEGGGHAIHDARGTVVLISPYGAIDWLRHRINEDSARHTHLGKPTHNCNTLGLKMEAPLVWPVSEMRTLHGTVDREQQRVVLHMDCVSQDGQFRSEVIASLTPDESSRTEYIWHFEYKVTCAAPRPVTLPWIEFMNVLPARTGCGFLFTPQKVFTDVLMRDREGVVWRFPHQHSMHYTASGKLPSLHFAPGTTWAGWFLDPAGCPVIEVEHSDLPPDWGICDMFYDLHCGTRVPRALQPGESVRYVARVRYLDQAKGSALLDASRAVPVTEDDRQRYPWPRLDLGMNRFDTSVHIDRPDDAAAFEPAPPVKVWDRQVGQLGRGSLRITNETPKETVWTARPPSQIPARTRLNLVAKVRTEGVKGKGMFLRVRYHTWAFEPPPPHVEIVRILESEPVTGTTGADRWVRVCVPALVVAAEHFDYLVYIEVVLDGQGVGWLTDLDVDLQPDDASRDAMQENHERNAVLSS